MEFSAEVTGLAAKDTSNGNRIELKLTAQFDTALFAQLGECFSDRVLVAVNHPQGSLDFDENEIDEELFKGNVDEDEEKDEVEEEDYAEDYGEDYADEDLNRKELREEIEKVKRESLEDPAGEPSEE